MRQLLDRVGFAPTVRSLFLKYAKDLVRVEVKLVKQKRVRMDGADVVRVQRIAREVTKVEGHDYLGATTHCSSQHVAVNWIIAHS